MIYEKENQTSSGPAGAPRGGDVMKPVCKLIGIVLAAALFALHLLSELYELLDDLGGGEQLILIFVYGLFQHG